MSDPLFDCFAWVDDSEEDLGLKPDSEIEAKVSDKDTLKDETVDIEAMPQWIEEVAGFSAAQNFEEGDLLFWQLLAKAQKLPSLPMKGSRSTLTRLQKPEVKHGLPGGVLEDEAPTPIVTKKKSKEDEDIEDFEFPQQILELTEFSPDDEGFIKVFPVSEVEIEIPGRRGDQIVSLGEELAELVQSIVIKINTLEIEPICILKVQRLYEVKCKDALRQAQKGKKSQDKRTIIELISKKRFLQNLERSVEYKLGILGAMDAARCEDRTNTNTKEAGWAPKPV